MVNAMNHINLATHDLEKSFNFYKNILGITPLCKWHEGAYFLVGDLWFCLCLDKTHIPANGYTHFAFNVNQANFLHMKNQIINSGAKVWKDNKSEGDSLYFLDPAGHQLELHVGSWQSRINTKKINPGEWKDVQFFI